MQTFYKTTIRLKKSAIEYFFQHSSKIRKTCFLPNSPPHLFPRLLSTISTTIKKKCKASRTKQTNCAHRRENSRTIKRRWENSPLTVCRPHLLARERLKENGKRKKRGILAVTGSPKGDVEGMLLKKEDGLESTPSKRDYDVFVAFVVLARTDRPSIARVEMYNGDINIFCNFGL